MMFWSLGWRLALALGLVCLIWSFLFLAMNS
jgi:hypothetical protein